MALLLLADPSARVASYVEKGEVFLAQSRDQVIGVFVILQTGPGTWEIMNVAVDPEWQGQGIGKRLIKAAIGEARARGARRLEIGTGNSSLQQLALYQKCGFRITGVEPDYFLRHYPDPIWENGIRCTDMIRLAVNLLIPGESCRQQAALCAAQPAQVRAMTVHRIRKSRRGSRLGLPLSHHGTCGSASGGSPSLTRPDH
jgi:N-acetylglutamate synthase-like GNAT family acetyltransferase